MNAQIKKICALFACLMITVCLLGGASADAARSAMLMERLGQSLMHAVARVFAPSADSVSAGSWLDLKLAALHQADEVIITQDIYYTENQSTVVFTQPVTLHSDTGNQYCIDGGGKQIMRVQNQTPDRPFIKETNIEHLIFQNGRAMEASALYDAAGAGGAVYVQGDLALDQCVFRNNAAHNGAAVFVSGSVSLLRCSINNNTAAQCGAVYVQNGDFMIVEGEMLGNKALYGGAVYVQNGQVILEYGFQIANNFANFGGGVYAANGNVVLLDGELSNNAAGESGGGVYVDAADFGIYGGIIADNVAFSGGGVYAAAGNGIIRSGLVIRNIAAFGGGIYTMKAPVVINGGRISSNTANQEGGGIYSESATVTDHANAVFGNTPDDIVHKQP